MPLITLPNGLGESTGATLATSKPLQVNGNVWYVNSVTGSNAGGDRGKNRARPLATLAQAQTNGANGDIVVLMDGHAETLTGALSITKDLVIVGAGSSGGKPTVKFTNNSAAAELFTVSSTYFQMHNVWLNTNAQSNNQARVSCESDWSYFTGIYAECSANDTRAAIKFQNTGYHHVEQSTFISTATSAASQPLRGIDIAGITLLRLKGVVFDGGTAGFGGFWAVEPTGTIGVCVFEDISLLRGADIKMLESAKGYINVQTSTLDARIDWCDISDPA